VSGPASLRLALAGACVAAVALAGCGGGGSTTVIDRTVTETTPSTTTTTTTTGTEPTTTASEAPTAILHLTAFQSPSGNIGCMIVGGTARCDIVKRDWSPPPHPARCPSEVDFGQGLEVGGTGTGRFVCAGDTTMDPSAAKLAYGTASRVGGFLCVSRSEGVTCSNGADGSGFFISIQGYRVF
jgi:hypothetical protein